MRHLLLALLLATALLPVAQASQTDPTIHSVKLFVNEQEVTGVDIVGNHGDELIVEVQARDADFGASIALVDVTLDVDGEPWTRVLSFAGTTVTGISNCNDTEDPCREIWRGGFPVDDARLLVGTHDMTVRVFDSNGGQAACAGTCGSLQVPDVKVTWDDISKHPLSLSFRHLNPTGGYPDQRMGTGDALQVDVRIGSTTEQVPWTLKTLTYTIAQQGTESAAKTLRSPNLITARSLNEGSQTVEVTATDRAGRTTTIDINAFVDTVAPEVEVKIPSVAYRNVTFRIDLDVEDANPFTAHVTVQDETQTGSGNPAKKLDPFLFQVDDIGVHNVLVRVLDDLGNQYLQQHNVTLVNATTDSTIRVEVTPAFPLPEENVTVRFIAQQQSGVTDLPFNVSLEVEGLGEVFGRDVIVPLNKPYEFTFERAYLPGYYEFNATIMALVGVNETDDSDQVDLGAFEVFLGKVTCGSDSWFIRVGDTIEGREAVSPGGSLYNMTAADSASGTVYEYRAGGKDLFWDPQQRVTDACPEAPDDPDNDAPGAPLVLLMAVLALGVALRRRM